MKHKRYLSALVLTGCIYLTGFCDVYDNSYYQLKLNNLELKVLEEESRSEILELMGENALANPEIEFDRVWGAKAEPRWGLSISQSFSFPGVYNARKKQREAFITAKNFEYQAYLIDLKLRVTELLVRLAYLNKATELQDIVVQDMNELEVLLKNAFQAGETTIIDYNKARIERTNALIAKAELAKERQEILSQLQVAGVLLNSEGVLQVNYPIMSLLSKEEYVTLLGDDPMVNYYEALKKSKLFQAKGSKLLRLPEFKVGYVHEYEDGISFNGFSVGMTLPFFGDRRKTASDHAQAIANEYRAIQARVERETSVEIEYDVVLRLKAIYDELAPIYKENNNIVLLDKAYKGGELTAIEYIREVDFFRSSEATFLEIERDYFLALSRLNKYRL